MEPLPPYTPQEMSRELSIRSRLLRWRAQQTLDRSAELRKYSAELRVLFHRLLFLLQEGGKRLD
jgi:hypothetical protein